MILMKVVYITLSGYSDGSEASLLLLLEYGDYGDLGLVWENSSDLKLLHGIDVGQSGLATFMYLQETVVYIN